MDLLTVVGHKFGAPKGVAALYIRGGVRLARFLHGGGQARLFLECAVRSMCARPVNSESETGSAGLRVRRQSVPCAGPLERHVLLAAQGRAMRALCHSSCSADCARGPHIPRNADCLGSAVLVQGAVS